MSSGDVTRPTDLVCGELGVHPEKVAFAQVSGWVGVAQINRPQRTRWAEGLAGREEVGGRALKRVERDEAGGRQGGLWAMSASCSSLAH